MPTLLTPFASWGAVRDAADHGRTLYYHAPLDLNARPVRVVRVFKNGKLRLAAGDVTFTADADHLERFRCLAVR